MFCFVPSTNLKILMQLNSFLSFMSLYSSIISVIVKKSRTSYICRIVFFKIFVCVFID